MRRVDVASAAGVGGDDGDAVEVHAGLAVVEAAVVVGLEDAADEEFDGGLAFERTELVGLLSGLEAGIVDFVVVVAEGLSAECGRAAAESVVFDVLALRNVEPIGCVR